jgi:hypothetical protein
MMSRIWLPVFAPARLKPRTIERTGRLTKLETYSWFSSVFRNLHLLKPHQTNVTFEMRSRRFVHPLRRRGRQCDNCSAANRCQCVDGTLETVEDVPSVSHSDFRRLIVLVLADFAYRHTQFLPPRGGSRRCIFRAVNEIELPRAWRH